MSTVHIPYRGQARALSRSGPALQDVLGGTVGIAFETVPALTPQLKSPRIRVLTITSAQRYANLPDVPTMTESGFKDFAFENWYGLFVPAKTPAPLVERLSQELAEGTEVPRGDGKAR